ncbi:MAG: hypothetical protein OK422_04225 [Thaumarchaeota archaeon]|nr:hypothetical protein [Nitrososphaerota archaeon]
MVMTHAFAAPPVVLVLVELDPMFGQLCAEGVVIDPEPVLDDWAVFVDVDVEVLLVAAHAGPAIAVMARSVSARTLLLLSLNFKSISFSPPYHEGWSLVIIRFPRIIPDCYLIAPE